MEVTLQEKLFLYFTHSGYEYFSLKKWRQVLDIFKKQP
jgi:hypothetical protein